MYRKAIRIFNIFISIAYLACVVMGIYDKDFRTFIFGLLGCISSLVTVIFTRKE